MRSLAVSASMASQVSALYYFTNICIEILELDLMPDDKFIVIASDGVWEFLSNDEIAKIVAPFFELRNAEKAAEAIVRESYLTWKREEEGVVDDITCVIVFLDVKLP
jgi:serine/threonine protein phosphatase PrpC